MTTKGTSTIYKSYSETVEQKKDFKMSTKIKTGKVRASYVFVYQPRLNKMSDKEIYEYSMSIIFPKTNPLVKKIEDAVELERKARWGTVTPKGFKKPLRDGDLEYPGVPEYEGMYYMSLKSRTKPGLVDRNLQAIIDPTEFVSGDYCRITMNVYSYDKGVNRGVTAGLGNIQFLEKGEPLGNMTSAESDFDEWKEDGNDTDLPF